MAWVAFSKTRSLLYPERHSDALGVGTVNRSSPLLAHRGLAVSSLNEQRAQRAGTNYLSEISVSHEKRHAIHVSTARFGRQGCE